MKITKLFLRALSLIASAGTAFIANAAEPSAVAQDSEAPPYRPWSVAAGIGSDGIFGVGAMWRFSDHMGMRLGVNGVAAAFNRAGIGGVDYDAKVRLLSEPLTLDVYPWKNHSFRISAGWMFNQNQLTGTASTSGGFVTINGMQFPTAAVGALSMKVEQQPVNPYLSLGGNLFYFDRAHRWAMAGEMGVAYTGTAQINLSRSGPPDAVIDAAVQIAENRLRRYANQFTWWPVVKLGVSYSF